MSEGLCNHNDSQMCHFLQKKKKYLIKGRLRQNSLFSLSLLFFYRKGAKFRVPCLFIVIFYLILQSRVVLYGSIPIYHTLCSVFLLVL